MLDYEIKPVNMSDSVVRSQVAELANLVFSFKCSQDKILLNTDTESSIAPTLYLGAFQGANLIGFSSFISHDLLYNGRIVNCYQVTWGMVRPKQEGKMIFVSLINEAKKLLYERGAGFIFAYPGANSYQILVRLLRFRPSPVAKVNVPAIRLNAGNYFSSCNEDRSFLFKDSYLQNDGQLIKLKKKEYGDEIQVLGQEYQNLIWGRLRTRKAGPLNLRYFSVGGMIINDPLRMPDLFYQLIKKQSILFVQFIFNHSNRYIRFFRKVETAAQTEPFVVFNLNASTSSETAFNFMAGIKDVF